MKYTRGQELLKLIDSFATPWKIKFESHVMSYSCTKTLLQASAFVTHAYNAKDAQLNNFGSNSEDFNPKPWKVQEKETLEILADKRAI